MKYILMKAEEINLINFEEIEETSIETLLMTDDHLTVVKWHSLTPTFLDSLSYYEGPFDANHIREILKSKTVMSAGPIGE